MPRSTAAKVAIAAAGLGVAGLAIATALSIKVAGAVSQLTGGPGEDYQLHWSYQPKPSNVLQAWNNYFAMSDIQQWKSKFSWNLIRLAFWFSNLENDSQEIPLDPTNKDGTLTLLDNIISICANNGFKVMLCCFNYTGTSPSSSNAVNTWISDWSLMAQYFAGDTRIAAYQIGNEMEPFIINSNGSTTQENTLQGQETLNQVMANCTDGIRKYEPGRMVVWCPELSFDAIINGGGTIQWRSNILKDFHEFDYRYAVDSSGHRISCTSDSNCPTGYYCTPEGGGTCTRCSTSTENSNAVNFIVSQRQKYPELAGVVVGEFNQIHEVGGVVGRCYPSAENLLSLFIANNIPYICWGYNAYRVDWDAILGSV
jgi:hypothetical protein